MSLEDVIIHIRIEEQNRNRDNVEKAKELSSKANVVEEKSKPKNNRSRKQSSRNKPNASNKVQNPTIKKKKKKTEVRILFDSDKIVLTKNDAFVENDYYNQGLFMLNVYDIINNNASSSFTYIVDSCDIWHGS